MTGWSEARGRAELCARSGGRCEVTGGQATDASHRVRRGPGGWQPWNLLHVARWIHAWWHDHPQHAAAGGWQVGALDPRPPEDVPVWLWLPQVDPWPRWYLLRPGEDGGPHVVTDPDPEPDYCPLPPPGCTWPSPY